MPQIHELTLIDLAAAIRSRQLSPVEVTSHFLSRIEALNAQVGAFYTVSAELAADQAQAAEKALSGYRDAASVPPLLGVPIPIKD
ncbi:MAG TPA: amidase family protein, partial [Streptosporangiaceae bacterium]|nr:amidase family protein [Streptosporangiaceae bacterium]